MKKKLRRSNFALICYNHTILNNLPLKKSWKVTVNKYSFETIDCRKYSNKVYHKLVYTITTSTAHIMAGLQ